MIPEFWPARSFLEVEKAERTAAAVVVGAVAQQSFLTQHKMFGKSMAARYRTEDEYGQLVVLVTRHRFPAQEELF